MLILSKSTTAKLTASILAIATARAAAADSITLSTVDGRTSVIG